MDLLRWLDEPDPVKGISIAQDRDGWTRYSYADLARLVAGAAEQIDEQREHDALVVAFVMPSGIEFVAGFFGALLAGATPSALAPPTPLEPAKEYAARLATYLRATGAGLVLTTDDLFAVVLQATEQAGLGRPRTLALRRSSIISPKAPADVALLQFTSGSTGTPRGVRLSWENLQSNIAAIGGEWLGMTRDQGFASWLPLFHDMGLTGCLLTPILHGMDLQLMRPEQFIRDPARWLRCFDAGGATLGCAPTFGFAYARKRVRLEDLQGVDLSAWRGSVIAAERLDAGVMRRFIEHFAPLGLRRTFFAPAFGLAEATLAVTGHRPDVVPKAVRPGWDELRFGGPAAAELEALPYDDVAIEGSARWVVSSGSPLPETTVTIVDDDGHELTDGLLGEITVRGPGVALGYHDSRCTPDARLGDGIVHTGDAGFVVDCELYVLGRIGDGLKVRGRNVYVEDLEARLSQLPNLNRFNCAVIAGRDGEGDAVIALAECPPGPWCPLAAALLRSEVGEDARVEVLSGRGSILRTTSGKPRRRLIWQRFLAGELPAEPVDLDPALWLADRDPQAVASTVE